MKTSIRTRLAGDDEECESDDDLGEDLVESEDEDQPANSAGTWNIGVEAAVPTPAPWKRLSQSAAELQNSTAIINSITVPKILSSVKSSMWWGARQLESRPQTGQLNPRDIYDFCIKLCQYYMAPQVLPTTRMCINAFYLNNVPV